MILDFISEMVILLSLIVNSLSSVGTDNPREIAEAAWSAEEYAQDGYVPSEIHKPRGPYWPLKEMIKKGNSRFCRGTLFTKIYALW